MVAPYKEVTVEIGGDTTKLQTALKGVNGQIKNTQSALKDVEKLLKLDPTNTTETSYPGNRRNKRKAINSKDSSTAS